MCIYFDMSKRLPKKTRMVLFGVTGVLAATFISIIPMFVFWCKPIETNWYGFILSGGGRIMEKRGEMEESVRVWGNCTRSRFPDKRIRCYRSIGPDICTPQANLFVATWTSLLNILTDLLGMFTIVSESL